MEGETGGVTEAARGKAGAATEAAMEAAMETGMEAGRAGAEKVGNNSRTQPTHPSYTPHPGECRICICQACSSS